MDHLTRQKQKGLPWRSSSPDLNIIDLISLWRPQKSSACRPKSLAELELKNLTELELKNLTELEPKNLTELELKNLTELELKNLIELELKNLTELELKNLIELEAFCQEEWANIPQTTIQRVYELWYLPKALTMQGAQTFAFGTFSFFGILKL